MTAIPIPDNDSDARRWLLSTPRGNFQCTCVIHVTNGYAGYLLPHLQGPGGIIPTRDQAIALQAHATLSTNASWASNGRFKYCSLDSNGKEEYPVVILGGGREAAGLSLE